MKQREYSSKYELLEAHLIDRFYDDNLFAWSFLNADVAKIDSIAIPKSRERAIYLLRTFKQYTAKGIEFGPYCEGLTHSNTIGGFRIKEKDFIEETLLKIELELKNVELISDTNTFLKVKKYKDYLIDKNDNLPTNTLEFDLTQIEGSNCKRNDKIEKKLIDSIRLSYSVQFLYFDVCPNIVPELYEHFSLMNKSSIDVNILRFYYSGTKSVMSDSEIEKYAKSGLSSKQEFCLHPYSLNICGAYYSRNFLFSKLSILESNLNESHAFKMNDRKVENMNDLEPYFYEYAKGFHCGFNEFENECVIPFLTPYASSSNTEYIDKVYQYITNSNFLNTTWLRNSTSFVTNGENDIIDAESEGREQGFMYRAWSIIFSHGNLFKPLFDKYYEADHEERNEQIPSSNERNKKEFCETQSFKVGIECIKNDLWTKKESNTYDGLINLFFPDKKTNESYKAVLKQIVSMQSHPNNFLENNVKIDYIIKYCQTNSIEISESVKLLFNKKITKNNVFQPKIVLELL
jgi:hypothetical protein